MPLPPSLPKELLVEQEDEEIDVDFGFVKEFHDSHTLILQLQEVLRGKRQGGGVKSLLGVAWSAHETLVSHSLTAARAPGTEAGCSKPTLQMRKTGPGI